MCGSRREFAGQRSVEHAPGVVGPELHRTRTRALRGPEVQDGGRIGRGPAAGGGVGKRIIGATAADFYTRRNNNCNNCKSVEPAETVGLGNGTRALVVDMSRTRVGSRQNGVARRTAGRVVRATPPRRPVAQDAPATAHHRRHNHETAADHRRYVAYAQQGRVEQKKKKNPFFYF